MAEPTEKLLGTAVEDQYRYVKGFFAVIILAAVLGFMGFGTIGNNPRTPDTLLFAMICFVVPAIICAILVPWMGISAIRGTSQFEVYKDGFVLRNTRSKQIIDSALWSEVDDILWSDVQKELSSSKTMMWGAMFGVIGYLIARSTESHQEPDDKRIMYILLPGRKRIIDPLYTSPDYVRTLVGSTAFHVWLAETLTALEKGKTTQLGNIQITPEGLKAEGQFAEWSNITDITREQDFVTIWWKLPSDRESRRMSAQLGDKGDVLIRVAQMKGKFKTSTPDRFYIAQFGRPGSLSERLGRL